MSSNSNNSNEYIEAARSGDEAARSGDKAKLRSVVEQMESEFVSQDSRAGGNQVSPETRAVSPGGNQASPDSRAGGNQASPDSRAGGNQASPESEQTAE